MKEVEQQKAAKAFAEYWHDKGYEKGESQPFWLSLLREVFGVSEPEKYIKFEDQVKLDTSTGFIDGFISETHVMIEQKGADKDLNKPIRQSDGSMLNPFQQAKKYITELPVSQHPRWVVTCNFQEFYVYDMEKPHGDPEKIKLADLEKDYYRLSFLVDTKSEHIKKEERVSKEAGDIVGLLYDALLKQYKDPASEQTLKSLNQLCVRLVFCLYAEDAGLFDRHAMFHDYLIKYDAEDLRDALVSLFRVLDMDEEQRKSAYLKKSLSQFPYVNGGLFAGDVEIPQLTDEIRDLLLDKACSFNWSEISPTIFGAVFESTLNPETRRSGGMHYTSIENIHKVIDPLFLNNLKAELEEIKAVPVWKTKAKSLLAFQKKLASLEFLDPAAGSGNFLTESYLSLRRLENEVISELHRGQISMDAVTDPIQISIAQFHGIEINDFAVTVAKTALWIAESQMMKETEKILLLDLDFLPLKTNANIVEGNALRIDWESVVNKTKLNYIMGNPPFVGVNYMSDAQREDMDLICDGIKRGKLDYVACWYIKASRFIHDTKIKAALVSTNSISQGEQAIVLWKELFDAGIRIVFAYRTFQWDSEASIKAHVHCVIIGFCSGLYLGEKILFDGNRMVKADNINAYLLDAPTVLIEEKSTPVCDVEPIVRGSQATDNGYYLFTPEEKEAFLKVEPGAEKYMKRFMMGREFINAIERWCLWMPNITPTELKKMPKVLERVQAVKRFREESKNAQTKVSANVPWRFGQYRKPSEHYIAFAKVSSQRRKYIPFGFLTDEIIPGDKLFTVPNATLYHFGILTSNVHMAWMRTVCGRLKSDYSYSTTIVYNNFPWPTPTDEQKAKIEKTAQAILDARAQYPDASLADLYDELTMPPELRKAHHQNDRAVWEAYGKAWPITSESDCVAALMKMYQELTAKEGN